MKNLLFGLLMSFVLSLAFLIACQNDVLEIEQTTQEEELQVEDLPRYDYNEIAAKLSQSRSGRRGLWQKIKKWFKDHAGTYLFENCQGSGNCGPCPGICLVKIGGKKKVDAEKIESAEDITSEELELGYRVFSIAIMEDEQTHIESIAFGFLDTLDFIYRDSLYIQDTFEFTQEMLDTFNRSEIIIYPGVYPIVYEPGLTAGATVVESEVN